MLTNQLTTSAGGGGEVRELGYRVKRARFIIEPLRDEGELQRGLLPVSTAKIAQERAQESEKEKQREGKLQGGIEGGKSVANKLHRNPGLYEF